MVFNNAEQFYMLWSTRPGSGINVDELRASYMF